MGPVKQIKKMFSSSRVVATIIALAMIVLTLVAAVGVSYKSEFFIELLAIVILYFNDSR